MGVKAKVLENFDLMFGFCHHIDVLPLLAL